MKQKILVLMLLLLNIGNISAQSNETLTDTICKVEQKDSLSAVNVPQSVMVNVPQVPKEQPTAETPNDSIRPQKTATTPNVLIEDLDKNVALYRKYEDSIEICRRAIFNVKFAEIQKLDSQITLNQPNYDYEIFYGGCGIAFVGLFFILLSFIGGKSVLRKAGITFVILGGVALLYGNNHVQEFEEIDGYSAAALSQQENYDKCLKARLATNMEYQMWNEKMISFQNQKMVVASNQKYRVVKPQLKNILQKDEEIENLEAKNEQIVSAYKEKVPQSQMTMNLVIIFVIAAVWVSVSIYLILADDKIRVFLLEMVCISLLGGIGIYYFHSRMYENFKDIDLTFELADKEMEILYTEKVRRVAQQDEEYLKNKQEIFRLDLIRYAEFLSFIK